MRSYGLGISFTMLIAALYAFQNKGDLVVRFLTWEKVLPQGVWEIALFALGCVVMWLISLSAIVENRNRNAGIIKDQKTRLSELEEEVSILKDERNSLMGALKRAGSDFETVDKEEAGADRSKWEQDVTDYVESPAHTQEDYHPEAIYEDKEPETFEMSETSDEETHEDNMEEREVPFHEELEDEGKTDN